MKRRTRFLLYAHGLTTLVHAVPTLALGAALPAWVALPVGVVISALTSLRLHRLALDRKRSRWVTLVLDEPLFLHWGACFVGLPLLVLGLPAGFGFGVAATRVALGCYAVGLVVAAWAIWGRRRLVRVRRLEIEIPGLPASFEGYRIAQLSDLHIGSFDPKPRGLGWARRTNRLGADLIVVTGDLVTSGTAFYEDVADVIAALSAPDGIVVSLGNHDQWDPVRLVQAIEARGPRVLRNEWMRLERNGETLVVAAVDDPYSGRDDLERALAGRPDAPTVLLAHYPTFFEPAAEHGVELVLSGHTHGGQIGLGDRLNIATLVGQHARGLVRRGRSSLYVNAGLGTTGPPMRLGIPPEIALLVLRSQAGEPASGRNRR